MSKKTTQQSADSAVADFQAQQDLQDELEANGVVTTAQLIAQHHELQAIVRELQRLALRLAELGHVKISALCLQAAVIGMKTKPGQV